MSQIESNSGTFESATAASRNFPANNIVPMPQTGCPVGGAGARDPSLDKFLPGDDLLFSQLQLSQSEVQLPLEIRNAVHRSALEIIATESRCVEWGAPAFRSIELAEEEITRIVSLALSYSQARLKEKVEAVLELLHATPEEFSPLQQEMLRELQDAVAPH